MVEYRSNQKNLHGLQHQLILENLISLNQKQCRIPLLSLQRKLCEEFGKQGKHFFEKELAQNLYNKYQKVKDRIRYLRAIMFIRTFNKDEIIELLSYTQGSALLFSDRVSAAEVLMFSTSIAPIEQNCANILDDFYNGVIYANRESLSNRLFCIVTISYTYLIYGNFPEKETWGLYLREKIRGACPSEFLPRLLNSYSFQKNIETSSKYNQIFEELSLKQNIKENIQVAFTNGMFNAIAQGDLITYKYYDDQLSKMTLQRLDLKNDYLISKLFYMTEWIENQIKQDLMALYKMIENNQQSSLVQAIVSYLKYKINKEQNINYPSLDLTLSNIPDHTHSFIKGIFHLENDNIQFAIEDLLSFINSNQSWNTYSLFLKGWAYRELINIFLTLKHQNTREYIFEFKEFINQTRYITFTPDYHKTLTHYLLIENSFEDGIINAIKATNGYLIMNKKKQTSCIHQLLEGYLVPNHVMDKLSVHDFSEIYNERNKYLIKYLSIKHYSVISEEISTEVDLEASIQKLLSLLISSFPISLIAVNYNFRGSNQELHYSRSGFTSKYKFDNYFKKNFCFNALPFIVKINDENIIRVIIYTPPTIEIKNDMDEFFKFVRPHLLNSILTNDTVVDTLTSCYLRRYFLEKLNKEFEISLKYNLGLSVLMLDIDNFRLVNNQFGHQEGDLVLKKSAEIIHSSIRQGDILGRYGGEEFLIILPKTDGKLALKLAEEIRRNVERAFSTNQSFKITVSIGVASLDRCVVKTPLELIKIADEAEIAAKIQGKNTVVPAWT